MLFVKVVGLWVALLLCMVANGAARAAILEPRMSEPTAHQVSSVTGSLIILFVTAAFIPAVGVRSTKALFGVGSAWLVLTVLFEFVFGRYVAGDSWGRLLLDYDLSKGRLWVLVLLTTFLAPPLAGWARGVLSRAETTSCSSGQPKSI